MMGGDVACEFEYCGGEKREGWRDGQNKRMTKVGHPPCAKETGREESWIRLVVSLQGSLVTSTLEDQ
jgi:hypothetical protein